ncbi:MAG: bifunctional diguanylate cyclase/phosphodiesterase [Caulobacterales bacterium]
MNILSCLAQTHDPWLAALAAAFCVVGAAVVVRLYVRARATAGPARAAWVIIGGIAAGSTIWCTHFAAMLAYGAGVDVQYDTATTAASLGISIVLSWLAFALGASRLRGAPELGGALLGIGAAAMHYVGMLGFRAEALLTWDGALVATSVGAAIAFGALSFSRSARPVTRYCRVGSGAAFVVAVVSLHFLGMAALTVTPLAPAQGVAQSAAALAFAVTGVGLVVIGLGWASYALERHLASLALVRQRQLIEGAIDGMAIEQHGAIVDANPAFAELLGAAPAEIIGPPFAHWLAAPIDLTPGALARATLTGAHGPVPVEIAIQAGRDGLKVYAVRDLRPRLDHERRLAAAARIDALTGLPNRAALTERLASPAAHRPHTQLALLAIDVARFKDYNDVHGQSAGDAVLRRTAERLALAAPEAGFTGRIGGDEFCVLADVDGVEDAIRLAERLEAALLDGESAEALPRVSFHIGVAVGPADATALRLVADSEIALARCKDSAGETICCFDAATDEAVRARRTLVRELEVAVREGQFEVAYQPQACGLTGTIMGHEALVRWRHPERGIVSPAAFIPIAEETGLINAIGAIVLEKACRMAAAAKDGGKIAVNLSAVQLRNPRLAEEVAAALAASGLDPRRLELEITETTMMGDRDLTVRALNAIKALGVSVAMDDFGAGYSSLGSLRAFPFDKIKMDKSFVDDLPGDAQAVAIVMAVVALAQSLKIQVLAEGVETKAQLDCLTACGCLEIQGYLIGRPAPRMAACGAAMDKAA